MKRYIRLLGLFFTIGLCAGQVAAADAAQTAVRQPARAQAGLFPHPRYPAKAVEKGLEGTVVLLVTVSAQNKVMAVEIAESSGHSMLDEAAVRAAWQGKFRTRGKPTQYSIPVRFSMGDKKQQQPSPETVGRDGRK